MLQQLLRRDSRVRMIHQSLLENVDSVIAQHWQHFVEGDRFLLRKIVVNVAMLETLQYLSRRRSDNIVDFVQLIELIVAGKERIQREELVEAASESPDVHLRPVES